MKIEQINQTALNQLKSNNRRKFLNAIKLRAYVNAYLKYHGQYANEVTVLLKTINQLSSTVREYLYHQIRNDFAESNTTSIEVIEYCRAYLDPKMTLKSMLIWDPKTPYQRLQSVIDNTDEPKANYQALDAIKQFVDLINQVLRTNPSPKLQGDAYRQAQSQIWNQGDLMISLLLGCLPSLSKQQLQKAQTTKIA